MHFIADGYNIINSDPIFSASTLEGRRNKLFEFILNKRPHGSLNNTIAVVFDFKGDNPYQIGGWNRSFYKEIEVIFSGGREIADDIITELVDNAKNPSQITVVTNDKGIWRRIGGSGAKRINVEDFISKGNGSKNKKIAEYAVKAAFANKDKINEEFEKLWLSKQK
ncbi:MAG: NYN domain-containing protein [Elusimicrobiota bacterium]|jgi:predicted RNA-binding protein with PIN domain|nr:NYN domain-containing protein [Elusimicrobiota bacterium]